MKYYISVKFNDSFKPYYFSTDDEKLEVGDFVVVETVVGLELGEITEAPKPFDSLNFTKEVKTIIRKASSSDIRFNIENSRKAKEAYPIFEEFVTKLKLNMNLINAQYTLDRSKILFTYVSEERVDFRELLKLLATTLKCHIELKQINARERAQKVGGIGACGLALCCTTFLHSFDGVSLSRVKNQMLSINIPKLSGMCGKLMCCLKYEDDLYTEEKKLFPSVGWKFSYKNMNYRISGYNILTKIVKVDTPDGIEYLPLDEVNKMLNNKKN